MQRVDAVPPAVAVGEAVAPVVGQIEDGEVENEATTGAEARNGRRAGDESGGML